MSTYRDALPADQRPLYDEAMSRAAFVVGRARSRRDSLTPEQAAEEAYIPGGPSREEIATKIRRHRAEAQADAQQTGEAA